MKKITLVVAALSYALSLPAFADVEVIEGFKTQARQQQPVVQLSVEQRLAVLERRIDAAQQFELLQRIDKLQQAVDTLHGQLDEQAHVIGRLRQQLQQVAELPPATTPALKPTSPKPSIEETSKVEASLAAMPAQEVVSVSSLAEPHAQAAEFAFSGDADADYHAIYQLLADRKYQPARQAFVDYINQYPDSHLVVNAYYWLGELQLKNQEYEQAFASFARVIKQYPDSPKVPDAILKQGYVHYALSNWQQARSAFETVRQQYPESASARLALTRIQQMNTQGL